MSDALRNAIAKAVTSAAFDGSTITNPWLAADAVLDMPEIVDMLALRRMCGDLTVEQVALGLRYSSFIYSRPYNAVTDDEKAISQWREPT